MKLKHVYLILAILGILIPYWAYFPYFMEYGFDLVDFIKQAYANPINAFLSWDLVVAAFVVLTFIIAEGKKLGMKYFWVTILCMIFIGTAFGFPLFMYLRENKLEILKNKANEK